MTLLLIPGFMADATLWNAMTDDLAPFGPLVATDLSQGEDIETMAAALLSDAPERFVAVGFSMGGYVARELARIAPERVTALILIATSARGDTEELHRGIAGSTLAHVADSGHMIPLEQPKALAKVMTDWLALYAPAPHGTTQSLNNT